jgi:hypothetical protein
MLKMADLSKPFIFRTDASNEGLEAVLFQEFENDTWPVAYASRKLLQREQNYTVVEKECLRVVFDIPIWSAFYITNRSHATCLSKQSKREQQSNHEMGIDPTALWIHC